MEDGRRGDWYTSTILSLKAAAAPLEERGGREGGHLISDSPRRQQQLVIREKIGYTTCID